MREAAGEIFELLRPLGRRKMALTFAVLLLQSVLQLAGVFSVLPFLSAAADYDVFRASRIGQALIPLFGANDSQQVVLTGLGAGSLAILTIGNAMLLFGTWYSARYAQQVGCTLRDTLVRNLLARRYEYFTGSRGSLVLKALGEDINVVCQWVVIPALDIVSRAVMVALMLLLALLVEPWVSAGAVVVMVAYYGAVVMPLRKRGLHVAGQIKEATRDIYFHINEMMAAVKLILVSNSERHFSDQIARASNRLARVVPWAQMYGAAPRVGFEILVFGGLTLWVLLLIAGGGDLVSNMPRVGLIALVAYRLMPSLQLIFASIVQVTSLRQSLDEVLDLLREQQLHAARPVDLEDAGTARLEWRHEIRFEDVSFTYRGADTMSLRGINLTIPHGARVAVAGATGSGKSTLVDLLMGLLEPTGGRILVDGEPLEGARLRAWRHAVGYVPQDLFLLNASVAENIAFGRSRDALDIDRVRMVAEQAHAMPFIERGPGLWGAVGDRGVRLSGGQRQRLALARALYTNPSVLVLDEATSALDPRTEQAVVQAIEELGAELTSVTVAHRLSTIENSDTIFFLDGGELIARGKYEALRRDVPAFDAFTRSGGKAGRTGRADQ